MQVRVVVLGLITFAFLLSCFLTASWLGAIWEVKEQVIERSWEGHAELVIVCSVDFES